jgi:Ca2+/Na+ antiporter
MFLWWMGSATLGAWIAWSIVLCFMDPSRAGALGFAMFYLTLAIALVGTWTLLGTAVRCLRQKEVIVSRHVLRSFRHSFLFTFLFLASFWLLSMRLWTWWLMTLLLVFVSLVEFVFLSMLHQRVSSDEQMPAVISKPEQ